MASKKFMHDLDLQSVGQVQNARVHNVTSVELTTLAGTLGAANRGYMVYNTTDSALYTWNGSSFDSYAYEVVGDVQFKGATNPAASSSITPVAGHQYVVDTAGTLSTQGGAITYSPSANVEVGDIVLFTSATTAIISERNLEQATETTTGTVALSTQAEVDAGADALGVVTPATLHGYVDPELTSLQSQITSNDGDISTLQSDLAQEITDRAADVDAEEARALAAESALDARLTTEEGNVDSLQTFTGEGTALDTAASDLAAAINEVHGDVDAEAARATAAEATLTSDLAAEVSRATAAEAANAADIATEASDRAAADTTLQNNIDAEAATRAADDATLQSNIDAEAATRAAADSALDGRVSAVEARDEVATYTASIDLAANTAFTVTHNLGLTSKDAFVINTMLSGEQVSLAVASVDTNSLTVESSVAATGVVVTVIGMV